MGERGPEIGHLDQLEPRLDPPGHGPWRHDRSLRTPASQLAEPLIDPMEGAPAPASSSHAKRIAAAAVARKDLGGRLWCAGVWLRLLTVLNGLALLAA